MNKKSIPLLLLLIVSLLLGSCNRKQNGQPMTSDSLTVTTADPTHQLKIGVVSLDLLYKSHKYYTQANKQIEAQLKRNQQTLANKVQKAQQAYANYTEEVQKGFPTTQVQVDAEEKRIIIMRQEGVRPEQRYVEETMEAQADVQKTFHDEVVAQFKVLNTDKKCDLILTSTGLEGVVYAGEGLDTTKEVLNFLSVARKAKANDTKKPKK